MCGIFGIAVKENNIGLQEIIEVGNNLFLLSESRGKEASGFCINASEKKVIFKTPLPANFLVKTKLLAQNITDAYDQNNYFTIIGHSRLVTNGSANNNLNNQPVEKNGIVGIHNGIIANDLSLWEIHKDQERHSELDSELLFTLLQKFYLESNNLKTSLHKTFKEIVGSASIGVLFNDLNNLLLATNNGSLFYSYIESKKIFIFASERYILNEVLKKLKVQKENLNDFIFQLKPFESLLLNLKSLEYEYNKINSNGDYKCIEYTNNNKNHNEFVDISYTLKQESQDNETNFGIEYFKNDILTFSKHFEESFKQISQLKRCKRCILPETFPFIEFDSEGVCNYCKAYRRKFSNDPIEKEQKFKILIDSIQSYKTNLHPDNLNCIVPFSGGRDSSYGLHIIKNVLKLRPTTYTYDWGMITDLARRNISRMCASLGVENILVSADIKKKREYIKNNVTAWLAKPDIGIIPLFMAGDKMFFHYLNVIKKQTGLKLNIWMGNPLENTDFKVGFCGIPPNFDKKNLDNLSIFDKIKMPLYYLKSFTINPGYFNSSIIDTLFSYYSYYVEPRSDFYMLFNYLYWDEKEIIDILINQYGWETDPGTKTTWRIGDGTAAFYNYIYYIVAGFSEIDTFRSNQIREGMISRDEALKKAEEENKPRWDSIKWYSDTIQIDFNAAIKKINQIKQLYPLS